ncbi:uncharacterized protein [Mytilus edulis]|uniref:uncharacterized protein n=1 Tax=Mytilus edulis TaxID=6550 RepID=UPI0039EE0CF1
MNGQWTCVHGRNIDEEVANITVKLNDTGNCNEQNLAWTFIGCLLGGLFVLSLWLSQKYYKTKQADWCLCKFIKKKKTCSDGCCQKIQDGFKNGRCRTLMDICLHYSCMFLFCISMLICLFLLPYTIGTYETQCTEKQAFTIVGFFVPGICLLYFFIREKWFVFVSNYKPQVNEE